MDGEARLRAFLAEHGIAAEVRVFERSTHSVAEAAAAAGTTPDALVKSICMVAADGRFVVAIVQGEDRASTTRVGPAVGSPVRLATPDEMLARTGYPAGGTPPLGFDATFLVDERAAERGEVWAGGGSARALLRIGVKEMLRANGGRVARVRK